MFYKAAFYLFTGICFVFIICLLNDLAEIRGWARSVNMRNGIRYSLKAKGCHGQHRHIFCMEDFNEFETSYPPELCEKLWFPPLLSCPYTIPKITLTKEQEDLLFG